MSMDKGRNDKIELTICRSVTNSKCIYIGSFRVYGSKPHPIGNNVLENYEIDIKQVEKALEFHKRTKKVMKGIFGSERLEQAMHRSLSASSLYPSSHFAFQQGWKAACKFLKRVHEAEEICCQCGKLLYESDNYFIYDGIGCFCEKCMNKIEKESKK